MQYKYTYCMIASNYLKNNPPSQLALNTSLNKVEEIHPISFKDM